MLKRYLYIFKMLIAASKGLLILRLISTIIESLSIFVGLVFPMYMIRALGRLDFIGFFLSTTFFVGISFALSIISNALSPKSAELTEKLNSKLVDDFLNKSMRLTLRHFEEKSAYDKYTLVFSNIQKIFQTSIEVFFNLLSALLQIIAAVIMLSWMNPTFFLLVSFFALIQSYLGNKIKTLSYRLQVDIIPCRKKLNYIYRLFYIPEFMRDVRVNTLFEFVFKKKDLVFDSLINCTYNTQKKYHI